MVFRTKYDPVSTFTPAGDPVHVEYSGKFDEKGILRLEKVGETNIYNEIQSHADSVDINNIIRRYESGEVDVLSRAQGIFADVTSAPRSYAEMLNLIRRAEEAFDALPADVRAKFDNSFEQFFAQDGMSMLYPDDADLSDSPQLPDQKEVKDNES